MPGQLPGRDLEAQLLLLRVWLVTKTTWAGRVCAYRPHQEVELGFLLLGS